MDFLHENGIDILDVQMVTPFTREMKGKYVSRSEFYSKAIDGKPPVKIDFSLFRGLSESGN